MVEKKNLYIIQMHTKSLPARFVRMMTGYKYSHVGLCLDKQCDTIYSFGRKSLHNVLDGGFVEEKKDGRFFGKFCKTDCCIYRLEVADEQYENVISQLTYIKEHDAQYKYDFLGAFVRFFQIPISFQGKYVCSHFIAEVLTNAGILEFDKKLCMVKPRDYAKQQLHEIYSGKYLAYKCAN